MARKGSIFFRNAQSLLMAIVAILMISDRAVSQITPDGTLGRERSVVTPNVDINGIFGDRLDGGATRGANLFHSFSGFNIGEGGRVYFANPTGIENIFSRVTGNTVSQILGTLGVNGNANLYFLNPNGIIFGRNARLDIRGSFIATTAERFVFNNGTQFSATNPESPLLTMSVPVGLQYGIGRGTITNQGILAVGQDLILSATNLTLSGQLYAGRDLKLQAQDTIQIRDSVTNPFIAYAGNDLDVQGNQSIDIFALNHPNSGFYSGRDMVFRSTNPVGGDAHYFSNGNFRIENLDGTLGDLYSPYDPIIRAVGDVNFNVYLGTSLHIIAGGSVTINTVVITDRATGVEGTNFLRESIPLSDGTSINIDGSTRPTLDIRAGVRLSAIGLPLGTSGVNPGVDFFVPPPNPTAPATGSSISIGGIAIDPNNNGNGVVFLTNQYKAAPQFAGIGDINIRGDSFFPNLGIDASNPSQGGLVIIDSGRNIAIARDINTYSTNGNGGDITLLANGNITNASLNSLSTNGKGGNINLVSRNGTINTTAGTLNTTSDLGNSGSITLDTRNRIVTGNIFTGSSNAQGGNINLVSRNGAINTTAGTLNTSSSLGNGGNVAFNARSNIRISNIETSGQLGGSIQLTSQTNAIALNNSLIRSSSSTNIPSTRGGNITLNADAISLNNSVVGTLTTGAAQSGNLNVNARIIALNGKNDSVNAGGFLTRTEGTGNAGNLSATVTENLVIRNGAKLDTSTINAGDSGNINVTAGQITVQNDLGLQNDGGFYANTIGAGNGGRIALNAPLINLDRGFLFANTYRFSNSLPEPLGNAGSITINTQQFTVQNGALVSVASQSKGEAGNISINAGNGVVNLIGNNESSTTLNLGAFSNGNAGSLTINTGQLVIQNGAQIYGSNPNINGTPGGNAANITINASQLVQVADTTPNGQLPSSLSTDTFGRGNAGNLIINTPTLLVQNGGRVSAGTVGTGQAGNLRVNANFVDVNGTSIDGSKPSRLIFDSYGSGNAGELRIDTQQLLIRNGGQVSAATAGTGRGGILAVNATDSVQVSGAGSGLYFDSRGTGDARGIAINTERLVVENGGQVTVSGSGTGRTGDLQLTAGSILLNNQGRLQATNTAGAGSIRIATGDLVVQNGSEVTVNGKGSGVSGDLNITARSIFMDNGGRITATTNSGEGGNINLQVDNSIILRHDSDIRTEALGTGNGGNININAGGFILAVLPENSDVIAGAVQGNGGKITATAQGIFGFRLYQDTDTSESDFTASSQLGIDGTVVINTLDKPQTDTLPNDFQGEDLDNRCQAGSNPQGRSSFVATGDGGLPSNPDSFVSDDGVEVGLLRPVVSGEIPATEASPANPPRQSIEEAQGWVVDDTGKVTLVGISDTPILQTSSLASASCQFTQRP